MIQFNLVPDVKLNYIKTTRLKHTITVISTIVAGAALFIMLLLFITVYVFQKSHIKSLNTQINSGVNSIKSTPNLNKILTVQNAVNALPALDEAKPVPQRLPAYMAQVTPTGATISSLQLDFATSNIVISGSANSLATVNTYVDTLEDTYYQTSSSSASKLAFSGVQLSSAAYVTTGSTSYSITLTFDPALFDQNDPTITLSVPGLTSTRSNSSSTTPLFQQQTTSPSGSGTN